MRWILRTRLVFKYFRSSEDFIMQKVHLLRSVAVYVGLIILAAYFCQSCLSHLEYNCSLIAVDWLDACTALRVVGAVLVCINREKYTFCDINSLERRKILKTGRSPYLDLELTMHVFKFHLVRQSL